MINYRAEILDSWVRSEPSARDLAALLGLTTPVTLLEIVNRLKQVESISLDKDIHTADGSALNGRVAFELRSNGTYVFSGHMRATGLPSYHYGVQGWVTSGDGTVVAAQQTGNVFGTDTPGQQQHNWSEPGTNAGVKQHWRSLRAGAGIGYKLHAEIGGVLGGALDVLTFAVKGLAANLVLGPTGWIMLIGNELAGMDAQIGAPNTLAGIVAAGTTLLIVGPFGLVPAIVAGAVAVSLADVKHRAMYGWERTFVDRVFQGQIDYNRIVLTNMTRDGGRKFAIPSVGNTILVNLGDAFDNPTAYQAPNTRYTRPGELFIHELTHAWQISHGSIVDLICGLSENYDYFRGTDRTADTSWQSRSWNGFNNEQQAGIVDDWYADHSSDLTGFAALNDPAYRFIRDHIRTGIN
jgi:hypothetical protein